mgnify:CR=1 FL=1
MISTLEQLINNFSADIFSIMFHIVITGAVVFYLKDLATRIVNYFKIKFSDFGRGTKVEFNGKVGYITKVGFSSIEIRIDDESIMIVPLARFLSLSKIIYTKIPDRDDL